MRIKVNKKGFFLWDVLVALVVLMIFLHAMGPFVNRTLLLVQEGRLRIGALERAIRVMEGVMSAEEAGAIEEVVVVDGVKCRQVRVLVGGPNDDKCRGGEICLVGPLRCLK